MTGQAITLVRGSRTVRGEIVLEHELAWQIAVDGDVEVYQKSEWAIRPTRFEDIFSQFGMSR